MNYNNFKVLELSSSEENDTESIYSIKSTNSNISTHSKNITYSDFIQNKIKNNISLNNLDELISEKTYTEPILLENINLEKYFSKNDIELSEKINLKLQITDKGLYSISKFSDAEWISEKIIDFLKYNNLNNKNITIIDATAGIGGNTINFSKYFNNIISVEINKTHYDVLNNNIKALSINNVETYFNNFLNILDILIKKTNIFFFDPPWGGKSYKNYNYYNLKIGKLQLYDILNILFNNGFKYVILKAPFNLNLSILHNKILYKNFIVHNNINNNMILVIFF